MIEIAFVLLMYISGSVDKYAYTNSIGECLGNKRQIERQYQNRYDDARWACEQYHVEIEEIHGVKHITTLVQKVEYERRPSSTRRSGSSYSVRNR